MRLETGLLAQTDTSYLIMAKNEQSKGPLRETVTMNTDTAATAGRKGEEHEHYIVLSVSRAAVIYFVI